MANPALSNFANGTDTATSLTISHTAETGKVVYYAIFGGGASQAGVSATYGGAAMTQLYQADGDDGGGNPRATYVFSYVGASAGAANAVFSAPSSQEFHGVTFNVSGGPVNGWPVLMASRESADSGTYTSVAPGWDAEGTCVGIGYRRVGGITSLTCSGSTTHANNGPTIIASVPTTNGEHSWSFLAGGNANVLLTFLLPNASRALDGGSSQVWFSGRTTVSGLGSGFTRHMGGLPYARSSAAFGSQATIGIMPQAGTVTGFAVKLLNGALGGSNGAKYEIYAGGGVNETACATRGVPTGVSVTFNASDTEVTSSPNFPFYKYQSLHLYLTNTGSGSISPVASVAVFVEGGDDGVQVYGGDHATVASNTVDQLAALSPTNPNGWSTSPTTHEFLVGINCRITELIGEASAMVTASPDRDFYIEKFTSGSWVQQDGTGGTPDTKATLLANTTLHAIGRKQFTVICVPGDRIRVTCYRRTGGSQGGYGVHLRVVASTPGQFMIPGVSAVGADTAVHPAARGDDDVSVANETQIETVIPGAMDVIGVIGRVAAAPGSLWSFLTRKNLAASGVGNMTFNANTTSSGGGSESFVLGDNLSCQWDVAGGTTTRQWWCLKGLAALPTSALQRVTRLTLLYTYNRYADADPPPTENACTPGGTVASGTNPTDGSSIANAQSLHAVFRITVNSITYDFAQSAMNYSTAKTPRVDRFGRLRRAAPDERGSIELPAVWIDFFDHDNLLRGWHDSQTLKGLTGQVLLADLTTWQAGGANAQVRFSGIVEKFEPLPGYRYRLTLESPLAPAFSETAQETLLPRETISISDGTADQGLRNSAAPHLYGSLSEEDGCIEIPFVGTETPPTDPTLGNRHKHLFGFGAIGGIEAVFGGDPLSGDPPTRRAAFSASTFTSDFLAPHISGGNWFESELYSVQDSARWTFGFLEQHHPAADLARYGRIPLTANVCGRETVGDGTGDTIDRAGRQALMVLNTAWANSVGDADHPAMATRNGFSIFNTQSFEAWQTITENNSGISGGYKGAFVLGHSYRAITLRTFIEWAFISWLLEMVINRWGQVAAIGLDRTDDASGVPHDRWDLHIKKDSFTIDPKRNAVENATRYVYRRKYAKTLQQGTPEEGARLPPDSYQEDWLSGIQEITNSTSITALGGAPRGRRESPVLEMELTRDQDTADDVAQQRNDLRAPANGRAEATYAIQMQRLDTAELGDLRTVTHPQGIGTGGWVAKRVQIRAIEEDWNLKVMEAVLTVRDVDDLLA